MKYTVADTGRPGYLQLYEQLRGDITEGVYPFGSRLPSKRLLSEELGISERGLHNKLKEYGYQKQ